MFKEKEKINWKKIVQNNIPKYQRKILAQKDTENFFILKKKSKYKQVGHIFSWTAKLIMPDFIIGHPSLIDNLKTLWRNPHFRPLRMTFIAWLVFTITVISSGIYFLINAPNIFAANSSITQTTDIDFNAGTLTDVTVVGTGIAAEVRLAEQPWLTGWDFRKPITITGSAGAGTNYQVLLKVGESAMATGADFHVQGNSSIFPTVRNNSGDLRFTDNDGTTLLDFWVENVTGTAPNRTATIWIEVREDLSIDRNIFIYYRNTTATNVSNGDNTFILFDDFEDGIIDPKWSFQGLESYSESGGSLNLEANTNTWNNLNTGAHVTLPTILSNYHVLVDVEWIARTWALASINLNIKSSIDSIARVGMHDSHAGNTGGRTAWSEGGEVFSSGRDTEPASGRINFEIYRLGNTYNFYYGGISILTGTGTSLANSIVLTNTRFQTHVGKTAKYHLIRVREYVSPEPNFAIAGAEETLIYHTSGTFISSNIDTGQESAFLNLDFNITEPANTNIQFRLRSAIDEAGLSTATWYGPTGTGDYYTTTGTAINPIHNGHRWVQYKAFFLTTDTLVTPNLSDITTHFTLFNQRPDTPTNVEPASGVNGQNLNLILTGSTYLDFESNPHINTEWRVDNDVNFLTPVWTRTAGVAETTTTVNDTIGTFANELNLKTELDHNTVYYWQVRYHDGTVWSDWSTATNFTTNIFHTPSNQLPVDMATGINLNAELSTSLFQNEQPGHTHLNTKWQVDDDADFLTPVWTKIAGIGEATTTTVTTIGTFANELAGKTELAHNTVYYWQVKYQSSGGQWSDWSTSFQFTTNIFHAPINQLPNNKTVINTFTPLLTASDFFNDQVGATHISSHWQVDDNADFSSPTYNSGETISAEISHSVQFGYLKNFNNYYWRVKYKSSGGQWSEWSSATKFSVNVSANSVKVKPILSGTFKPGTTIPIEVQVLNFADGSPLNSAIVTVSVFNPAGTKVVDNVSMTYQIGSHGVYQFNFIAPAISGSYRYEVSAVQISDSGYGSANFHISRTAAIIEQEAAAQEAERSKQEAHRIKQDAERAKQDAERTKQEAERVKQEAQRVTQEVERIKQDAERVKQDTERTKEEAERVKQETERTAQEISRTEISEIKKTVKSGLLDMPKTAKIGNTITIKYRASSGLVGNNAPKLNFFNANNIQKAIDKTMSEIDTTGIYYIDLNLENDWGTGFFTIIVSENANNTSDNTQIFIGAHDIQDIGVKVKDTQNKITNIQENMDILVGAMIVTRSSVDDLSATTTSFKTTLHNSTDDFYKNAVLTFTSGELYGQSRRISNYDGKYKKITLDPALTSAPNNIDRFTIITQNVRMEEQIIDHEKLELIERIKQKDERIKQKDERIKQEDFRKDIKKDNKLVLNKIDSISTNINHIKTTNIDNKIQTETMIPILNHISSDLKQVLTNIDAINFSDNQTLLRLLDISEVSSTEVNNIKNKLADLQAVSSVTRKIVEQSVIEPIIETWMTFDSVVFNFLITNPTNTQREKKFKSFLPTEVKPEYIIDLDGLNINFDVKVSSFYVYQKFILDPKESVKKAVKIKDIWVFSDEEIVSFKKQSETLFLGLNNTQYQALGTILKNQIQSTLEIILLRQAEGYRSPQDHIMTYRENKKKINEVYKNLEQLKSLVVQAGSSQGMVGQISGIQTFATWGIILSIIFGFGLLSVVIFAMWRHQTKMSMIMIDMKRKRIKKQLGEEEPIYNIKQLN